MNILLVSASKKELSSIIKKIKYPIDYLITGIGTTSLSYLLTKKIQNKNFDLIINIGIAGSFKQDIPIGEIVFVKNEIFADLGIEEKNKFVPISKSNLSDLCESSFSCNYKHSFLKDLPRTSSITVCRTSGQIQTIKERIRLFNPDIENMEGAAFFQICQKENIPFVEIRSISNFVTERDSSLWNIPLAITNLEKFTIQFINLLNSTQ